nr:splicing factor 3B subunit 4 [Ipomoea batatas]
MTTRIAPGVGANLLGQHSAERNQDATAYVGNLDPQIIGIVIFVKTQNPDLSVKSRFRKLRVVELYLILYEQLSIFCEKCEGVSEELLWELFVQAGPVVNVYVPKDRVTNAHQGYGFVEFRSEEDADYAIKVLNMIKLYGKPIRVNKASQDKKSVDVGANLFVGNLDPDVDEKLLYDTFSAFGVIVSNPKIMRDPETGNSRGFGFISYDSFEASDAAIEAMNGQYLCNRQITVSYAYKKDTKGERHGTPAERVLAASNPTTQKNRPHTLFASGPPTLPPLVQANGTTAAPLPPRPFANSHVPPSPIPAMRPPSMQPNMYRPMQIPPPQSWQGQPAQAGMVGIPQQFRGMAPPLNRPPPPPMGMGAPVWRPPPPPQQLSEREVFEGGTVDKGGFAFELKISGVESGGGDGATSAIIVAACKRSSYHFSLSAKGRGAKRRKKQSVITKGAGFETALLWSSGGNEEEKARNARRILCFANTEHEGVRGPKADDILGLELTLLAAKNNSAQISEKAPTIIPWYCLAFKDRKHCNSSSKSSFSNICFSKIISIIDLLKSSRAGTSPSDDVVEETDALLADESVDRLETRVSVSSSSLLNSSLSSADEFSSSRHLNSGGGRDLAPELREVKPQPTDIRADETWRLRAEEERWVLVTGKSTAVMSLVGDDEDCLRNEGTGSSGRVEVSLELQDCRDVMTLDIRSLKGFAIVHTGCTQNDMEV